MTSILVAVLPTVTSIAVERLAEQGLLVLALVAAVIYLVKRYETMTERLLTETKERDRAYETLVASNIRALEELKGLLHDKE